MSKSKLNKTVSRKEHLVRKALAGLEHLESREMNTKNTKEFKTLCRLMISENLTTQEYTGLISRIILLAKSIGAQNG
jgi:hypothetical protein